MSKIKVLGKAKYELRCPFCEEDVSVDPKTGKCSICRKVFNIEEIEIKVATKPFVQLSGQSDNVFSIIGRTIKALKKAGQTDNAEEFKKQARQCKDYDAVLHLCDEFCEVG